MITLLGVPSGGFAVLDVGGRRLDDWADPRVLATVREYRSGRVLGWVLREPEALVIENAAGQRWALESGSDLEDVEREVRNAKLLARSPGNLSPMWEGERWGNVWAREARERAGAAAPAPVEPEPVRAVEPEPMAEPEPVGAVESEPEPVGESGGRRVSAVEPVGLGEFGRVMGDTGSWGSVRGGGEVSGVESGAGAGQVEEDGGVGLNLFGEMQALPQEALGGVVEDDGGGRSEFELDPWERREREERERERAAAERLEEVRAGAELQVPAEIPAGREPERGGVYRSAPLEWSESAGACMPLDEATICKLDPMQVMTDAEAFQYKAGGTASGVIGTLADVERWDNDLAGVMYVWQRRDGQLFVVDGHQRLDLAKRMVRAGQENVALVAKVWREEDGFDQQEMRLRAAKKNISEGSGSAVDAARVLKQDPTLLDSVSKKSELARNARGLAKLEGEAFVYAAGQVNARRLDAYAGALVGEMGARGTGEGVMAGEEGQLGALMALVRETERNNGHLTRAEAEEALIDIRANMYKQEGVRRQGAFDIMQAGALDSAYRERARLRDAAKKKFADNRRLFNAVVKGDSKLEEAGNELDDVANLDEAQRARMAEALFTGPTATGPLAAWLRVSAKEMQARDLGPGESKKFVAEAVRGLDPYLEDWGGSGPERLWQWVREEEPRVDARIAEDRAKLERWKRGESAGEGDAAAMRAWERKEKERERLRVKDAKRTARQREEREEARREERAVRAAGGVVEEEDRGDMAARIAAAAGESSEAGGAAVVVGDTVVQDVTPARGRRKRERAVGKETPPEVEAAIEQAVEVQADTGAEEVQVVGDLPGGDQFRVSVRGDGVPESREEAKPRGRKRAGEVRAAAGAVGVQEAMAGVPVDKKRAAGVNLPMAGVSGGGGKKGRATALPKAKPVKSGAKENKYLAGLKLPQPKGRPRGRK